MMGNTDTSKRNPGRSIQAEIESFNKLKSCIYISGPPCAGKSTVARRILQNFPGIEHISGDEEWLEYPHLPFDNRVTTVNQALLDTLLRCPLTDVLLEWVPWQGLFLRKLLKICRSTDRRFLHIVLTAPVTVLKKRKRLRDQDDDLGTDVLIDHVFLEGHESLVFDTDAEDVSVISGVISKRMSSIFRKR